MLGAIRRILTLIRKRTCLLPAFLPETGLPAPCWIKTLDLPLPGKERSGWKIYRIFRGSTASMKRFNIHVSVLSPGRIPHPLHEHREEELLVLLSGKANIVTLADTHHAAAETRIAPESVVYHPAGLKHTIQAVGHEPATYLVFKWEGGSGQMREATLPLSAFPSARAPEEPDPRSPRQFLRTTILDYPTRYLRKLHCHVSTLRPGGGYPPHSDAYDVAILTLSGTVETLGRRIGPGCVVFYASGKPHGMRNPDTVPSRYLVIEFHGGKMRRRCYLLVHQWVHLVRRRFMQPLLRRPG